jgi:hypothetical protein
MIELTHEQWNNVRQRLIAEHGASILISYVCKKKLGFTVRDHKGWRDNPNYTKEYREYEQGQKAIEDHVNGKVEMSTDKLLEAVALPPLKGRTYACIYLDFYNDSSESWFRLKYL